MKTIKSITLIIVLMLTSTYVMAGGIASWYGNQFHNKRTASGSIYNQWGMTAAHKTLPFGSEVRVTNLKNNKSVVLKITDRGPYAKGRVIDISRKANQLISCHLCKVEIDVLSIGDGKYKKQ